MSQQAVQFVEIAIASLVFVIVVLRLARRGLISFRYAMGWLSIGLVLMLTGVLIPLVGPIARVLRLGEFTIVAAVAILLLLGVCVQLSISISGLQRQVQALAEEIALGRAGNEGDDER